MNDSKSSTNVGKDQHGPSDMSAGDAVSRHDGGGEPLRIRLGRQLQALRDSRGLDIPQCGEALRLPVRILRKLEAGDYDGIDHGVYLRNYLETYGAYLGMPEAELHAAVDALAPREDKPQLVSTGGISRSHYMWQRYTTAATYVVLTAVIVVPLVWLGMKGGLDRELTHLEPLNSAPVAKQELALDATDGDRSAPDDAVAVSETSSQGGSRGHDDERPLMASMAPFSALDSVAPVKPRMPDIKVPGSHVLRLTLSAPSWVEITNADGERLEYSLLPAGTERTYRSSQPLQVNIGDAGGARVVLDGKPVELTPYQRANVARFRVSTDDGEASIQTM